MKPSLQLCCFSLPSPYPSPFPFLMAAKFCCYLLYTSFQTSFSPLDFPLLKPLIQTGSFSSPNLEHFPILSLLDSHISHYFHPNQCGGKKKAPKRFHSVIVRSMSCTSLPFPPHLLALEFFLCQFAAVYMYFYLI